MQTHTYEPTVQVAQVGSKMQRDVDVSPPTNNMTFGLGLTHVTLTRMFSSVFFNDFWVTTFCLVTFFLVWMLVQSLPLFRFSPLESYAKKWLNKRKESQTSTKRCVWANHAYAQVGSIIFTATAHMYQYRTFIFHANFTLSGFTHDSWLQLPLTSYLEIL